MGRGRGEGEIGPSERRAVCLEVLAGDSVRGVYLVLHLGDSRLIHYHIIELSQYYAEASEEYRHTDGLRLRMPSAAAPS